MNEQEIRELRAKLLMEAADLLQALDENVSSAIYRDLKIGSFKERDKSDIAYFKVWPKDMSKCARLHILDNGKEYHGGEPPWKLRRQDLDAINRFIRSPYKSNSKYTVWDAICMCWNERNLGIQNIKIEKYMNGEYDKIYKNKAEYIPPNTPIPDWRVD